ncbi:MAG: caspase family protein [Phycisphaerae bacterium]|nr:caspase family protein [Phycisphaerae bacterium]
MKRIMAAIMLTMAGASAIFGTSSAGPNPNRAENNNTHALIVTGINKNAKDRQTKDKAVVDLRNFLLNNASVKRDRLAVLANSRSLARTASDVSTAENIEERIDAFAAAVNPADRFVFYYVGQANVVADELRLNLPGADITHEQLAEWLGRIKASSILIVLDCPGAGLAVKALAGEGRIVVAGCTADQHYSTRFSAYFVPALGEDESDTDNDGKVSLLEAFTSACRQLDDFYRSMGLLKTETPLLEDNGDGAASDKPWRFKQDKTDGAPASKFFLSSKK